MSEVWLVKLDCSANPVTSPCLPLTEVTRLVAGSPGSPFSPGSP